MPTVFMTTKDLGGEMMNNDRKYDWPHKCSCVRVISKEEAIDAGPDVNGHPVEWYHCPFCGTTFVKFDKDAEFLDEDEVA